MSYIVLTPKEESELPSIDEEPKSQDFDAIVQLYFNESDTMDF